MRVKLQQEVENCRLSAAGGGTHAQQLRFEVFFLFLYMTNLIEMHKYNKVKEGRGIFLTAAAPNSLLFS